MDGQSAARRGAGTTVASGDVDALVRGGRMAALGELARGAAHEINNPVFAILTLADFLVRDAEPGTKAFERLQLIESSAKDIQAVVERMHAFARDRAGTVGPLALEDAARGAADLVRRVSGSRTVEIVERYATPAPLVTGDAAELNALFVHLLENGLQAMPGGGVLTVEVGPDAGDAVAFVRDEGAGIPAAEAERVFALFHTTRNGAGTGLGLTCARAIAERHGGSLIVDTRVERGACLVLRLPERAA